MNNSLFHLSHVLLSINIFAQLLDFQSKFDWSSLVTQVQELEAKLQVSNIIYLIIVFLTMFLMLCFFSF